MDDIHVDLSPITTLLCDVGKDGVVDFSKVAAEFVIVGANEKLYAKAAKKLSSSVSLVQTVTETFIEMYREAAFRHLEPVSLATFLSRDPHNFPSDVAENIAEEYSRIQTSLLDVTQPVQPFQRFVELKWRFDVEVESRSQRSKDTPAYLLQFITAATDGKTREKLLSADVATLKQFLSELESAYAFALSAEYKKMAGHRH